MKTRWSIPALLWIAALLPVNLFAQIAYVDADATGLNDGSSWANAFTSIQSALALSSANELWIAEGLYHPNGSVIDTAATFSITRPLALYGGFSGTETALEQRLPYQYQTMLSGDLLNDDVDEDFTNNKADNARHVVTIDADGPVILDGITVAYGFNRDPLVSAPQFSSRGAGVHALSPLRVVDCTFSQNRGGSGAGVFAGGEASSGSAFINCIFVNNRATSQSVLFTEESNDLTVSGCLFVGNLANRGGLYPAYADGVLIENCEFAYNINEEGFGGGAFFWQVRNVQLRNCKFDGNRAANAAGFYADARELTGVSANDFVIEDCLFKDNITTGFGGGGMYIFRASYTLRRSSFTGNSAVNSGGAIINGGDDKAFVIDSCQFVSNTANFGAALTNYNLNTQGVIRHCRFEANDAATSGGAAINGFKAEVTYSDCIFEANRARWGGALYVQNDTSALTLSRCQFNGNTSDNFGGAINVSGGIVVNIDSCLFEGNASNFGGAISISDSDNDLAALTLTRSWFNTNLADSQGGGLNLISTEAEIVNCVFNGNIANDPGIGGAISINNGETNGTEVSIVNCTIADNTGLIGSGIASWAPDTALSVVRLQNTVLANDGPNYAVEAGFPQLLSGGGNFVTDLSAPELNAPTDRAGEDLVPGFTDAFNFDYSLAPGSPLINAGVSAGAPADDITGSPRDASPDIGAFEALVVGVRAPEEVEMLAISPNPASGVVWLSLPDNWTDQPVRFSVSGADGRVLWMASQQAGSGVLQLELPALPAGQYWLSAESNGQRRIGALMIGHSDR